MAKASAPSKVVPFTKMSGVTVALLAPVAETIRVPAAVNKTSRGFSDSGGPLLRAGQTTCDRAVADAAGLPYRALKKSEAAPVSPSNPDSQPTPDL